MDFVNFALYLLIGSVILVPAISLCVLLILNGWLDLKEKRTADALKKMKQLSDVLADFKARNGS